MWSIVAKSVCTLTQFTTLTLLHFRSERISGCLHELTKFGFLDNRRILAHVGPFLMDKPVLQSWLGRFKNRSILESLVVEPLLDQECFYVDVVDEGLREHLKRFCTHLFCKKLMTDHKQSGVATDVYPDMLVALKASQ